MKRLFGMFFTATLIALAGFFAGIYGSPPSICKVGELNDPETVATAISAATERYLRMNLVDDAPSLNVALVSSGPAKEFLLPSEEEKDAASFVILVNDTSYVSVCIKTCYCDASERVG